MAKQTVHGPYRVRVEDSGYEIVLRRDNSSREYQPLIPRRFYIKDKRESAYRAVALLNRDWQKEHQFEEDWTELLEYWQQATN